MAYTTVKTVWHSKLEAVRALNVAFVPDQYSTLNEDLGVQSGVSIPAGSIPNIAYLAIGRGGHRNVTGTGGESLVDILQHRITDATLFDQMPFVLREVTNDLSAGDRAKYRLRRTEIHGGVTYFAYYLRAITLSTANPVIEQVTVAAGAVTKTPYVPVASQLAPVPVSMTNGVVNTATGTSMVVSVPVEVTLDSVDIAEIVAAAAIIHGDARFATISEVAVVSGIDNTVTSTDGGITVTYTEAIAAQCCNFIGADINLTYSSDTVNLAYRLSSASPYVI